MLAICASSHGGVSVSSTLMSEDEAISCTQLRELMPGALKLSLSPLIEMFRGKLLPPVSDAKYVSVSTAD